MVKSKMDLGKALATMGLGTARLDDAHGKRDAQVDLNESLTRLMEAHEKKKKKVLETEKIEQRRSQMADKLRNEVRTIHEAYQFLSRKYQIDKERLKEKERENQQIKLAHEEMKLELQRRNEEIPVIEEDKPESGKLNPLQTALALKSAANAFKDKLEDGRERELALKSAATNFKGKIDEKVAWKDANNKKAAKKWGKGKI